jgi:hypothetical protein
VRITSGGVGAAEAVGVTVPLLLSKGLVHPCKDAQALSVVCLRDVATHAGKLLAPHVAALVPACLEAMSSLEAPALAYLQTHSDAGSAMHGNIGLSSTELEAARVTSAHASPFGEILSRCLAEVTDEALPALAEALGDLVQGGIGLPARAGAAKYICRLVDRARGRPPLREASGRLLSRVGGALPDRSGTLRAAYAAAGAALCTVAKPGAVKRYVARVAELAGDGGDAGARATAALALGALVRSAGDRLADVMGDVVPLVYMGTCDPDAEVAAVGAAGPAGRTHAPTNHSTVTCSHASTSALAWARATELLLLLLLLIAATAFRFPSPKRPCDPYSLYACTRARRQCWRHGRRSHPPLRTRCACT